MKEIIECKYCHISYVIIENNLFFSEDKLDSDIVCSSCNRIIESRKIDGWFFVQTVEEYEFEEKIEKQKLEIIFHKP